jgi:hypothetical protein
MALYKEESLIARGFKGVATGIEIPYNSELIYFYIVIGNIPMRKRLSSLVLITATTIALSLPTQASAAFQPGKFFSSVKERVSGGVQRLYLRAVPGSKDGQAVIKQSFMAMEDVTSYTMNMTIDGTVKQNDEAMGTMKFTMEGPVEVQDIYDPSTMKQDWKITAQVQVEGVQISGAGELIIDGQDTMYAKLTEIPLPVQEYKKLKDQWLKINMTTMQTEEQPEMTDELQEKYEAAAKKLYESADVSQARKEKWNNKGVFVVDAQLSEDALMAYIEEVYAITAESTNATKSAMTTEEKDQLKTTMSAFTPIKTTMWIDRGTFRVVHAEIPIKINLDEYTRRMNSASPQGTAELNTLPTNSVVDANIQMSFDNYNQPVKIDAPADARPIEEVMQEVMGGTVPMMGGSMYGAPAYGSGYAAPSYPGYGTPQELPNLTDEQQQMLKQYGY